MRMVNGAMTTAVAIKTDGQQTIDPACVPPTVTDKASLLAAIQACGLVGVGGRRLPDPCEAGRRHCRHAAHQRGGSASPT